MDIKQGLSTVAAVTLGKDMTFRDYAQGAFRMRGIGKGQKVQVRDSGRRQGTQAERGMVISTFNFLRQFQQCLPCTLR